MKFGDLCRSISGAPARYICSGKCLFISTMCNDLTISDASPATGGEDELPLPSTQDLIKAHAEVHR